MCHPLCNWSYRFGKRDGSEAGSYPKRMLGRKQQRNAGATASKLVGKKIKGVGKQIRAKGGKSSRR